MFYAKRYILRCVTLIIEMGGMFRLPSPLDSVVAIV